MATLDFSASSPLFIFRSHLDDAAYDRMASEIISAHGHFTKQVSEARTLLSRMTEWKRLRADLRAQGVWTESTGDSEIVPTIVNDDTDQTASSHVTVLSIDWIAACGKAGHLVPIHSFIVYQGYRTKKPVEGPLRVFVPSRPESTSARASTDTTPMEHTQATHTVHLTQDFERQPQHARSRKGLFKTSKQVQLPETDSDTVSEADSLPTITHVDGHDATIPEAQTRPDRTSGEVIDLTEDSDKDGAPDTAPTLPASRQNPPVASASIAGGRRQPAQLWPDVGPVEQILPKSKSRSSRKKKPRTLPRSRSAQIDFTGEDAEHSDEDVLMTESSPYFATAANTPSTRTMSPDEGSFVDKKRKQVTQPQQEVTKRTHGCFEELTAGAKAARTRAIGIIHQHWPGVEPNMWLPDVSFPPALLLTTDDHESDTDAITTIPARDWDSDILSPLAQLAKLTSNDIEKARNAMLDVVVARFFKKKTLKDPMAEVVAVLEATKKQLKPQQAIWRSVNALPKQSATPRSREPSGDDGE